MVELTWEEMNAIVDRAEAEEALAVVAAADAAQRREAELSSEREISRALAVAAAAEAAESRARDEGAALQAIMAAAAAGPGSGFTATATSTADASAVVAAAAAATTTTRANVRPRAETVGIDLGSQTSRSQQRWSWGEAGASLRASSPSPPGDDAVTRRSASLSHPPIQQVPRSHRAAEIYLARSNDWVESVRQRTYLTGSDSAATLQGTTGRSAGGSGDAPAERLLATRMIDALLQSGGVDGRGCDAGGAAAAAAAAADSPLALGRPSSCKAATHHQDDGVAARKPIPTVGGAAGAGAGRHGRAASAGAGSGSSRGRGGKNRKRKVAGIALLTESGAWVAVYDAPGSDEQQNVSLGARRRQRFPAVFSSEHEAQMTVEALAPPVWETPGILASCVVCARFVKVYVEGKERKCQCWNCGNAMCNSCTVFWPKLMMPPLYTMTSTAHRFPVCKNCHLAAEKFRGALLLGNVKDAKAAYDTGCVNIRSPYTTYHGEMPVHCAAAGGNVELLRWLIEDRCCPILAADGKTSLRDGRQLTLLGAAAVGKHVKAMRYLIKKHGCKVQEIKHIPTLRSVLEACLLGETGENDAQAASAGEDDDVVDRSGRRPLSRSSSTRGGPGLGVGTIPADAEQEERDNTCIVCFDRKVDCTLVPCGHHCCCLECSSHFNVCPVCRKSITQKIRTISV